MVADHYGITYLLGSSLHYVFPALAIHLVMIFMRARREGLTKVVAFEHWYLAIVAFALMGVVTLNGGDHFPIGRFLVPVVPLLFIAVYDAGFAALAFKGVGSRAFRSAFLLVSLGIALVYWKPWDAHTFRQTMPVPHANPDKLEYLPSWDTGFILSGKALASIAPKGASVAVVPVGAIGCYSGLKVVDMVGLVDPVIAHEPFDPLYTRTWRPGHDKGEGAYVLSRHPDFIQLVDLLSSQPMPAPDAQALQYKSVVEIWNSPKFHAEYEYQPYQTIGGWYVNYYRRIAPKEPPRTRRK